VPHRKLMASRIRITGLAISAAFGSVNMVEVAKQDCREALLAMLDKEGLSIESEVVFDVQEDLFSRSVEITARAWAK
jgi:hypothetical protein